MTRQTGKTESESQAPSFEQAVEQLEQTVRAIESGQIPLEQSIERYEQGMKLIQHCRAILERAETKIKNLTLDEKGQVVEKD